MTDHTQRGTGSTINAPSFSKRITAMRCVFYLAFAPGPRVKENSAHSGIRPEIQDFTHSNLNVQIANELKLNLLGD